MECHYATIWESIADTIGDREAVVCGDLRRTWSDYEDRAARLAQAFAEAGLGEGSKVGLYLYNSSEYLETQFASMKGRGVPININYRYLDDELLYLLENSDAEALVFHSSLGDRVARVMKRAPKVRLWIQVDDGGEKVPGAVDYEALIAGHDPAPRITRSVDDTYMLYTGGTTGMPKGVMYDIGGMCQLFLGMSYATYGLAIPEIHEIGAVARQRWDEGQPIRTVPQGYFTDEAKSATTFKTIDGVRYSFPGDWALIEADGSLTLLGRGSNCINTAGEKVYPEEVEEAVKSHPDVVDCLVVGVEDEKFGQRVTGVASVRPGATTDAQTVREFTRGRLAAYKVPKDLFIVETVQRAPNGKADYGWARKAVEEALEG